MIKPVIQWTPKVVQTNPQKNEWVGVFRTKVDPGTKGAIRHQGEIGNTGKHYDYWGIDVTKVSGYIRWIDKVLPAYTGAETKIIIYIEGKQAMHKVEIPYDAGTLHNIMNVVCGIGKNLPDWYVNLSYWVRPKKDENGNIVFNDKGLAKLLKTFQIADVQPHFNFQQWKDYSEKHGLEWTQKKRADGKKEWVTDAALKYWDSRLVSVQRFLLGTPGCLPFTYGSLIACPDENPSGGGNLTAEEIEKAKSIYEARKAEFRFQYNRESVDADSVVGIGINDDYQEPSQETKLSSNAQSAPAATDDLFPSELNSFSVHSDAPPAAADDLPF